MSVNVQVFKLQDICKDASTGNLDYRLAMKMINSIANILNTYSEMNILIDQREVSFSSGNLNEILEVLESLDTMRLSFTKKIANVIPDDQNRLRLAMVVKTVLNLSGGSYEVFTDYDKAMSWLDD